MDRTAAILDDLHRIRKEAPLVHNITNYVVMNLTANALLALGASPVMAHAIEEVAEMAALARALVLNIGTLSPAWIEAMLQAGRAAREKGAPVILDPVGAGATRFRTETAHRLLDEVPPAVIRGNASEIRALALAETGTKGVDSTRRAHEALDAARTLAAEFQCVVSVSGPTDLIVSPDRVLRVLNGHSLMPRVTGLGCVATALTAAFAAVNPSPLDAAAHAMAIMGIAGEMAAKKCEGPGSFAVNFIDALYRIGDPDVRSRLRLEEA